MDCVEIGSKYTKNVKNNQQSSPLSPGGRTTARPWSIRFAANDALTHGRVRGIESAPDRFGKLGIYFGRSLSTLCVVHLR
jgi:hypothetical protein